MAGRKQPAAPIEEAKNGKLKNKHHGAGDFRRPRGLSLMNTCKIPDPVIEGKKMMQLATLRAKCIIFLSC